MPGWVLVRPNVSGFTCATNMPPPGREVQAERPGTLPAYRVRCKPLLGVGPYSDLSGASRRSRTRAPRTLRRLKVGSRESRASTSSKRLSSERRASTIER